MGLFKKKVQKIHDRREDLDNKAATLLENISKNETFTKLENQGADQLVAMGIEAGIAIAESIAKQDIPVSEEAIHKVADKGGDGLVVFVKKITARIVKQLRK